MTTKKTAKEYRPIDRAQIPEGVRFDVTQRNSGQAVEWAYGGFGRAEHDDGDLYLRITDRSSVDDVRYFKMG